ncbi:MAG: hypothetical protein BWY85_00464 [Firmicutes bacterium ADurb.Bin506]|nr:MAG: hypothetical protein BWY85_00464 [Firmicutes bacterium ADurb.Bin506]
MDIPLNDAEDLFQQGLGDSAIGKFLCECGQNCGCPVNVRYQCGECCLKAMNCKIDGIVNGFLGLRAFSPQGIITEPCECEEEEENGGPPDLVFPRSDGSQPDRHGPYPPPPIGAQCALIPLNRVCSIESTSLVPGIVPQAAE